MKKWNAPEINELSISATAQTTTTEMSADDFQNGWFKQGTGKASGPKQDIPYFPNGNSAE